MKAGSWVPDECLLGTTWPFAVEAKCPPWTADLIARCDGRKTSHDLLELLKSSGSVPPDAPEAEFAKFVRALIAGGFLEIADFAAPKPV
jgi:hypothetical protein